MQPRHRWLGVVVVAGLWLGTPTFGLPVPTPNPCVRAAQRIHADTAFFPTCSTIVPGTVGIDPRYKLCLAFAGPRLVDKPTGATVWSTNARRVFDVDQGWQQVQPSEVAALEVLVMGDGPLRRVAFNAEWHAHEGGARFKYMIRDTATDVVYLNHGEGRAEGQSCQNDGWCKYSWATPPGQLAGTLTHQIAAGLTMERVRSTSAESVDDSVDQWEQLVCQGGGCQVGCGAHGYSGLWLFTPLLLVGWRWGRLLCLAVLLVPLQGQAAKIGGAHGVGHLTQGRLPHIIVDKAGGRQDRFDAVPGLFVTQGEPIEGGCLYHEGVRGIRNNEAPDPIRLLQDEACRVTVADAPLVDADTLPQELPRHVKHKREGGAQGTSFPRCYREIYNRTTVQLQLANSIENLLQYPIFFDWTRLSRVQGMFRGIDHGPYAPGLSCWGFESYASSLNFFGWETLPNVASYPDLMQVRDPDITDPIMVGLLDLDPAGRYCMQTRLSVFDFTGSMWLVGMAPGFRHAILAGCAIGTEGFWQCAHIISPDSVLPAQHVQIYPTGSFLIPSVDMPYFTVVTWEGYHRIADDPESDAECPDEWQNRPPYVWTVH